MKTKKNTYIRLATSFCDLARSLCKRIQTESNLKSTQNRINWTNEIDIKKEMKTKDNENKNKIEKKIDIDIAIEIEEID